MVDQRTGGLSEFPFLVTIEIDPRRVGSGSAGRPGMLNQGDAEQMLAHLAADLGALLGGIRNCRLTAAGALYDQCQILRPQTPVFAALSRAAGAGTSRASTPGLTAAGVNAGRMADAALEPDDSIPPGVLLILPMLAAGPEELIASLSEETEHRFLAEGQVSAHTASWLESAFGIAIDHARFMTLTDLNAMFRMQLERFGYLPLWTLIDAAVFGTDGPEAVVTDNGTHLEWRDGHVHVCYQTFDAWAKHAAPGSGAEEPSGEDAANDMRALAKGYAEWSRELRRYTSTLAAHRVPVAYELPAGCAGTVTEDYLYEEIAAPPAGKPLASVTEHAWPEFGTVAMTVLLDDSMRHYYPLTPQGLNRIHEELGGLELAGEGMAFPGTIKFDPGSRRLRPAAFDPT